MKPNNASWLCLFDLDGTLLRTGGASSRCMHRAGQAVVGPAFEWGPVTEGLLDPQLFAQQLQHNAMDASADRIAAMREAYLRELREELRRCAGDVQLLSGVPTLLETLRRRAAQRDDVIVGLLTGNYQQAAALKLEAAEERLDRFNPVCCAEHAADRSALLTRAMQTAEQTHGAALAGRQVLVIGDTPRDIACAHSGGCVAVGVATGRYTASQLKQAGADLTLGDLADPAPLLAWLK
jgi:phosphoglycolate phosphatase-like HAD superfamily hydrolase